MNQQIRKECSDYWNHRAEGYSRVNEEELDGMQHTTWARLLDDEIQKKFPTKSRADISVLDIGAGPGFLSIVLAELGYTLTAADYSEEMLSHAKSNAAKCGVNIRFCRENAEELTFPDAHFDVVISRNLTWNLPNPQAAYKEWCRVLKSGGMMLVFDANWYRYLINEDSRKEYEEDRKNVAINGLEDYNIGKNFDIMETIAEKLPMTGRIRPAWDKEVLQEYGFASIDTVEDIGRYVYSEKEKLNYKSTPLFMIRAIKE